MKKFNRRVIVSSMNHHFEEVGGTSITFKEYPKSEFFCYKDDWYYICEKSTGASVASCETKKETKIEALRLLKKHTPTQKDLHEFLEGVGKSSKLCDKDTVDYIKGGGYTPFDKDSRRIFLEYLGIDPMKFLDKIISVAQRQQILCVVLLDDWIQKRYGNYEDRNISLKMFLIEKFGKELNSAVMNLAGIEE